MALTPGLSRDPFCPPSHAWPFPPRNLTLRILIALPDSLPHCLVREILLANEVSPFQSPNFLFSLFLPSPDLHEDLYPGRGATLDPFSSFSVCDSPRTSLVPDPGVAPRCPKPRLSPASRRPPRFPLSICDLTPTHPPSFPHGRLAIQPHIHSSCPISSPPCIWFLV